MVGDTPLEDLVTNAGGGGNRKGRRRSSKRGGNRDKNDRKKKRNKKRRNKNKRECTSQSDCGEGMTTVLHNHPNNYPLCKQVF